MSSSNYFFQDKDRLAHKREVMVYMLKSRFYRDYWISYFLDAYDFFCDNPSAYNGATMSQDLHDIAPDGAINGLELAAMLHDWLYVVYNVSTNRKYMKKADKVMKWVMEDFSKSGFEIWRRMFALWAIRWKLTFWRGKVEKREPMTARDKSVIDKIYEQFKR